MKVIDKNERARRILIPLNTKEKLLNFVNDLWDQIDTNDLIEGKSKIQVLEALEYISIDVDINNNSIEDTKKMLEVELKILFCFGLDIQ